MGLQEGISLRDENIKKLTESAHAMGLICTCGNDQFGMSEYTAGVYYPRCIICKEHIIIDQKFLKSI